MSEFEADDVGIEKEGTNDFDLRNKTIQLERLYISFPIQENSTLTIGKFNSDVGFWNQTPINVLHDTTTPPHVMKNLFPKLTTGVSYTREIDDEKSLSLTLQHNGDFDDEYNNLFIKEHYSLGFKNYLEDYNWQIAGGYFKEINKNSSTYATIGIEKEYEKLSLLGEFYTRHTEDKASVPYDIYLQSTYQIFPKHDIVLRAETYKDEIEGRSDKVGLIGYLYRPYPFMAIKGEYETHTISRLNHAVFSFSVIF